MVVEVLFWILLILSAIGFFLPPTNQNWARGGNIITLILIALLGWRVFHGIN